MPRACLNNKLVTSRRDFLTFWTVLGINPMLVVKQKQNKLDSYIVPTAFYAI